MDTKNTFRKSLLSSAIFAATLQSLSGTASAGTCPPPNASNNVHVSSGEFCEGGITVEPGGPIVNDIGLEGFVVGDVVNNDGMSDFWMNAGTLDGSFVNNGSAQDVYIANGSEIFADIRNNGDMRYITVNDGPGTPTVVHGSIVNTGGVVRVHINGAGARIGGDVVNTDGATIAGELSIHDGASVAGNVFNNGDADNVIVDGGSSVGGDFVNNGSAFGLGVIDESSVAGDFVNNGQNFYFVTADGSSVGGSMINTGMSVHVGIHEESSVTGDFGNEGYIDGVMVVDNSTVTGDVYNGVDGYTSGLQITDGSSVGNVTNSGEAGFVVAARSEINGNFTNDGFAEHLGIYDSQVSDDVVNNGDTGFLLAMGDGTAIGGDVINTGYIHDGIALVDGVTVTGDVTNEGLLDGAIQVVNGSSVGGNVTNNGDVFVGPGNWNFAADGAGPMAEDHTLAAISIDAGSTVTGDVVNNGNLIISFPPPPPPLPDGAGPIPDGMGLEHSLAGISVDHGGSVDNIVNTGTIEVTAGLEHDGPEFADGMGVHANGIQVINGSTSGSIINDGAILADTFGIYVDGSGNDGVTVEGSVVNAFDGSIITQNNGIYIRNAEVTEHVVNEGVINSSNDNAIDIEDSVIGGSVVNLGSLVSNEDYDAIDIDDTSIGGDVLNFGDITGEDGIDIDDSNVTGSVANMGVITAVDEGFDIDQSDFGGSVGNAGLITAGGIGITIEGEENTLPPVPDGGAPVTEIDYVTIGGDFINVGEIIAGEHGIQMEYVDIAGNFDSSGSIHAGPQDALPDGGDYFHGIELDDVNIGGNMTVGDISASGYGVNIDDTTIGGDMTVNGTITSLQEDAINLDEVDIGGSLTNSGDLSALYDGIDLSDVTIGGELNNSGNITTEDGSGIVLDYNVSVAEGFTNSGDINANDYGIWLVGDRSTDMDGQLITDGLVSVGGDFVNSGNITTRDDKGIYIHDASIGGVFTNEGDITTNGENAIHISGHSEIGGDISNRGNLFDNYSGITLRGDAELEDGQLMDGSIVTVGGGLSNSGDIYADDKAIYITGTDIAGVVDNSGTLESDGSSVLRIDDAIVGGIANSGTINNIGMGSGVDIDRTIINGNIENIGSITGNNKGLDLYHTSVDGSIVNGIDGVIEAGSDAIMVDVNSVVMGDIVNDGMMTSRYGDALELFESDVNGSVINNGDMTAGNNGIRIRGEDGDVVTIGGNLENNGIIAASVVADGETYSHGIDGIYVAIAGDLKNTGTITASGKGVELRDSSISGQFFNDGVIEAADDGVRLSDVTIGAGITNYGDILSEDGNALKVEDGLVVGNIENHGLLAVTSGIDSENDGLDVESSVVLGSIINTGSIDGATEGIRINNSLINGDVVSTADGEINAGSDAIYIKATEIAGNVINHSELTARKHDGIDINVGDGDSYVTSIGGNLVNTGNMTAGDNGFELDGKWQDGYTMGTPDGDVTVPAELTKLNIGGYFYNSGDVSVKDSGIDLELVSVGTNGVLEDGQANFENHGMITTGEDAGIKLIASDVAGDFINTGDISVENDDSYSEGDQYRRWTDERNPDGELTLTAVGTDEEGNSWFRIKNEGLGFAPVSLTEQDGDFDTGFIPLESGQEVYVTVGDDSNGTENYVLSVLDGPGAHGEVAVAVADLATDFQPAYNLGDNRERQGISLTSKVYGEGSEFEQLITTSIGGSFKNSGNISAIGEGIYLNQVSVGSDFVNQGDVESLRASAIDLSEVTIAGNFVNTGNLNADQEYISEEGDSYREEWSGTPSEDGQIVLESKGIDENGNQWVVIRNESTDHETYILEEAGGNFVTQEFSVEPGEEIYVNVGELDGDVELKHPWSDGEAVAATSGNEDGFSRVFEFRNGISVVDADIGGHFVNEGDIASIDEGIYIDNVSIGGQIENTGDITSEVTGILVDVSEVGGGLLNTGTINVGFEGISITDSTLGGPVVNTGDITSGWEGIYIEDANIDGGVFNDAEINAMYTGIDISDTNLSGSVVNGVDGVITVHNVEDGYSTGMGLEFVDGVGSFANHGSISSQGSDWSVGMGAAFVGMDGLVANTGTIDANGPGIALFEVHGASGIHNTGTINSSSAGIQARHSSIYGDVVNGVDGQITVERSEDGHSVGIELDGVVGVDDFINHGTITTLGDGWGAGMMVSDVLMDGVVGNTGTINSGSFGMALFGVDGATGLLNEGTINAQIPGMFAVNSSIDGDIVNFADGVINTNYEGIFLGDVRDAHNLKNHGTINVTMGDGITVFDTDFEGNVVNTGDITAGRGGISLFDLSARNVINTGSITAGTFVPEAPEMDGEMPLPPGPPGMFEPYGNGITLVDVDLDGVISNQASGVIDAHSDGILIVDATARGLENLGSVTAGHHGLAVIDSHIVGNVYNNGTIDAGEDAIRIVDTDILKADGDGSMMTGHIVNGPDGVVIAGDDGIRIRESFVQGNIENYGSIDAGENAIDIDNAFVDGHVLNAGMVTAGETAIDIGNEGLDGSVYVDGAIVNAGSITAGHSGIRAENVHINGDVLNVGSIGTDGLPDGMTAGIGLTNVEGVDNLINDGVIVAGQAGGDGNIAFGMAAADVSMDGEIVNSGSITSSSYGIYLDNVRGTNRVVNEGSLTANQSRGMSLNNMVVSSEVSNTGTIDSLNSGIYMENVVAGSLQNDGTINVTEGHGIKVVDAYLAGGVTNHEGKTINAGHHGISLDDVTLDGGSLLNLGTINAGQFNAEGNGMEAFDSTINGQVANTGTIDAAAGGIVLDNTEGVTDVINQGTISAGGAGISLADTSVSGVIENTGTITAVGIAIDISADNDASSVGGLTNTGTITSESGPAIKVSGATLEQLTNVGTITGAVVSADSGVPAAQANRNLNNTNPIAFDFRDAGAGVSVLNDQGGIINGDVYGSDQDGDVLTLASDNQNQFTGDIYDVENINLTGVATLNNSVFSFNSNSTFTVAESGSLIMGSGNDLNLVGEDEGRSSYVQEGALTADININERSYDDAIVETTNEATLEATATISLSLIDQDIRNLDTTDGGANMAVVRANQGITNNGANYVFGADSQSILLNIAEYNSEDGTESGATIAIADLGEVAAAGGADSNASNALAALQGIDSAGLVELIESNPELYEDLWNGSVASLATLAEELVASPENGIAAGQAAQAEAVNTILTRIAELRTGASGISTGDSDEGSSIRPDSLWIRAIYSDGKQDATTHNGNNFNSYALRSKGFTIGADKDVSDTLTLGVGASVVTSTANEKGNSQQRANSETDTYLGSLYAGWRDQDYFADASINFGKGKTDLKAASWEADYDSTQIGVSVLAGKSFLFNNNDTLVEPRVGFNYTRLETDGYSYQDQSGTTNVGSQNLEALELGAGVRFITGIEVGNGTLLPEASFMAWHDFKGDEVKVNVEFETSGGSFTYFGPEAEKTRYQAGVGAEYLMDNNFTVSVNYEHNWQDGFKADTWVAKLRYDF